MGNDFGLGLVLSFTDHASVGLMKVTNTISTLEQSARGASSVIDSLGNSMNALYSVGSTFSSVVTTPIAGFLSTIMNWGVKRASSVQQLEIAFESLMGSAKEAGAYLDVVMGYAKTTPYKFDALAQTAQTLISMGMDANDVLHETSDGFGGLINALGDWSGAMAKGVSGISIVSDTLGKIQALGKVDTIYVQSLERQGLLVSKMLGNLYGKTEAEMKDVFKTMDVKTFMSDLTRAIEEGTDGPNGTTAAMKGMVEKLKYTWEGAKDTFTSALTTAGQSLMGVTIDENGLHQNEFLNAMTTSLNNISESIKNIASVLQPLVDFVRNFMLKGSEYIKKISEAYAALDDDTKRHIGNVVATLTLLGPALILFSQFGKLIIKTVGFLRSFASTMGLVSLVMATSLFGVISDFGGMGKDLSSFLDDVFNAISDGVHLITGDTRNLGITLRRLKREGTFFDNLAVGVAKVAGFFKILADAWSDFTISEENYDLMETLGLTSLIEGILIFKYNASAFFKGFRKGMMGLVQSVRDFFGGIRDNVKGTFLEKFLDKLDRFFDHFQSGDASYFESLGESVGKILPVVIALQTVLPLATRLLSGFGGVGNAVGGLLSGVGKLAFGGDINFKGGGILSKAFEDFKNNAEGEVSKFDFIKTIFEHPFKTLKDTGSSLISMFTSGIGKIGALLKTPLGIIGIIITVLTTLYLTNEKFRSAINGFIADLVPILMEIGGVLMQIIGVVLDVAKTLWDALQPVIDVIVDLLIACLPMISAILEAIVPILKMIIQVVKPIVDIVMFLINGIVSNLQPFLEMLGPILEFIGPLLGDIFGMLGNMLQALGAIIANVILAPIKGVIWLLDKIPGVNIDQPDWVSMPDAFMATGGIVTKPTNAIIGEDGAEAVVPLENNTDWIKKLAGNINRVQSSQETTNNSVSSGDVNFNFNSGSIVVQSNGNVSNEEASRLAKLIMENIAKNMKVNAITSYNQEAKIRANQMSALMVGHA